MLEPGTGLTILGAAIGSAKLVEKVLGPTADYLGTSLKEFAQQRVENIGNIIRIAAKRLGKRIDQPGQIPPKVLKILLDDGGFCDDPLAAEYFAGVLASSRGEVSRDDRGAYFLSIIRRLTSYHLRTHYIYYSLVRKVHSDKYMPLSIYQNIGELSILIPLRHLIRAMNFDSGEFRNKISILTHVLAGLAKESLIGELESLPQKTVRELEGNAIVIPTILGIELFLWAHGFGDIRISNWLKEYYEFPVLEKINLPAGCVALNLDELR